jgi:hypothetical protein
LHTPCDTDNVQQNYNPSRGQMGATDAKKRESTDTQGVSQQAMRFAGKK